MPTTLFSDLAWRSWGKQVFLTRLRLYQRHGQDDIHMILALLVEKSQRTRRGDRAHRLVSRRRRAVRGGTAKKRRRNRREHETEEAQIAEIIQNNYMPGN